MSIISESDLNPFLPSQILKFNLKFMLNFNLKIDLKAPKLRKSSSFIQNDKDRDICATNKKKKILAARNIFFRNKHLSLLILKKPVYEYS